MNISSDKIARDEPARRSSKNLVDEYSKLKVNSRKLSQQKESKLLAKNQRQVTQLSKAILERVAHFAMPRKVVVVPEHRSSVTLKREEGEDVIFGSTM
jgi:hypothetical protein